MTQLGTHHMSETCVESKLKELQELLESIDAFVIAVSGGIDSMLLAVVSGRLSNVSASMIHAASPAVPSHATERVISYAKTEKWQLEICDVGEFGDERYLDNPVNRCFYCKSNLYKYIESKANVQILSGTNKDDLADYRPGLKAAEQFNVRHPYVEAGIDKSTIRKFAKLLGLRDLSELPASPCLSSRIETGIPIDGEWLEAVDDVEESIRDSLQVKVVRCRIRRDGFDVELAPSSLSSLSDMQRQEIQVMIRGTFPDELRQYPVRFREYRMGSAFLRVDQ